MSDLRAAALLARIEAKSGRELDEREVKYLSETMSGSLTWRKDMFRWCLRHNSPYVTCACGFTHDIDTWAPSIQRWLER